MIVAGTYLNDNDIAALTEKLRECGLRESAARLDEAYHRDARTFPLSAEDHEAVLRVLDDGCSDSLRRLGARLQAQFV